MMVQFFLPYFWETFLFPPSRESPAPSPHLKAFDQRGVGAGNRGPGESRTALVRQEHRMAGALSLFLGVAGWVGLSVWSWWADGLCLFDDPYSTSQEWVGKAAKGVRYVRNEVEVRMEMCERQWCRRLEGESSRSVVSFTTSWCVFNHVFLPYV